MSSSTRAKTSEMSPVPDQTQTGKHPEVYADAAGLFPHRTTNDPESDKLAIAALKILAIARRPLSILELGWAVAPGVTPLNAITSVESLAALVDHQRVLRLSCPFVNTDNVDFGDVRKRQLNFKLVQPSAAEFIVGRRASGAHLSEILEAEILDICIRYLLLDPIGEVSLFSEDLAAIKELPQSANLFDDDDSDAEANNTAGSVLNSTWEGYERDMARFDPAERGFGELFAYASCHWIEHFGTTSGDENSRPHLKDIENLCQAGSTRISNWISQNSRPDCTLKARFEFDSSLYDPLSITALYGSEAMLRRVLKESDFDDMSKFKPVPAMEAADQILQWGELSRLRLLWSSKIGLQVWNMEFFRRVLNWTKTVRTGVYCLACWTMCWMTWLRIDGVMKCSASLPKKAVFRLCSG